MGGVFYFYSKFQQQQSPQSQILFADASPVTLAVLGSLLFAALVPYVKRIALAVVQAIEGAQDALDVRNQERKARIGLMEIQAEQSRYLFEEIKRRDILLENITNTNLSLTETLNQTHRIMNQERDQHNQDMEKMKAEVKAMIDKDQIIIEQNEALAKENISLKNTIKELETRIQKLIDENERLRKESSTSNP